VRIEDLKIVIHRSPDAHNLAFSMMSALNLNFQQWDGMGGMGRDNT
jgi:hypothetical protein